MSGYESLAPFYDATQGDRADHARYLRGLIERHHPEARTLLELACGTGSVLKQLRQRFEVTGVDASAAMLELAAAKVPGIRLIHANMTEITLGERFDVVLCVYDSINHLLRFEEWEALFDRARDHLAEGGVFVFDMNTQRKLEDFGRLPPWPQWFGDGHFMIADVLPPENGISVWDLRVFERVDGDEYRLHVAQIPEAAFPAAEVTASLRKRFRFVRTYDERRTRPTPRSERLHFVCGL